MLLFLTLFFLSTGASADMRKSELCAQLVASAVPHTSPIDYTVSDTEETYFALIERIAQIGRGEIPVNAFQLQQLLALKANFLNQAIDLVREARSTPMDKLRRQELLLSSFLMIGSLGIPPELYGLEPDVNGLFAVDALPPVETADSGDSDPEPEKQAIGFGTRSPGSRDLPDQMHRSIGFGREEIYNEAPPARRGGQIAAGPANDRADLFVILDGERRTRFRIPVEVLSVTSVTIDGKEYSLQFNSDIHEWIVAVGNPENATGRIGFVH